MSNGNLEQPQATQLRPERENNPIELTVKDFDCWYGSFQALHKINLEAPSQAVTALIGPSGCGKSTFLRWVNRMNELIPGARAQGSMMLNGQDLMSKKLDVVSLRRRVGMVFQKPNPFPKSIYSNIAFGPRLHYKLTKKQTDEIVESSLRGASLWDEVKDRLNDSAMGLSGGQQQRLCIARTIALSPEVILMDEPCSALDPQSTLRVEELIRGLADKFTILIVTHNMQQASRVSHRTAFFYEGRIVEAGPTESLFENPQQERTANYIAGRFG